MPSGRKTQEQEGVSQDIVATTVNTRQSQDTLDTYIFTIPASGYILMHLGSVQQSTLWTQNLHKYVVHHRNFTITYT